MFSLSNTINNIKALIIKEDNRSTETSVEFFNGEVKQYDEKGRGQSGEFDFKIYMYRCKKLTGYKSFSNCCYDGKAVDVEYINIL